MLMKLFAGLGKDLSKIAQLPDKGDEQLQMHVHLLPPGRVGGSGVTSFIASSPKNRLNSV